jgi:hypothetical protein
MTRKALHALMIFAATPLAACGPGGLSNPFGGSGSSSGYGHSDSYGSGGSYSRGHDDGGHGSSYGSRDRDAHIAAERRHLEDEEREEQQSHGGYDH